MGEGLAGRASAAAFPHSQVPRMPGFPTQTEASDVPRRRRLCQATICGWLPPRGARAGGQARLPDPFASQAGPRGTALHASSPVCQPPPFLGGCPAADTEGRPLCLFLPHADDNSNQSSIADASPIKQENSSNSSPAPEPTPSVPGDGADSKADEAPAEGKELPGAEGTCAWGPWSASRSRSQGTGHMPGPQRPGRKDGKAWRVCPRGVIQISCDPVFGQFVLWRIIKKRGGRGALPRYAEY